MVAIDVARARAETPGCEHVVHLNNAGAALMPAPVIAAVRDHLGRETAMGGYEAAEAVEAELEAAYAKIARLVGAAPGEIAFIENATRAWDMAFYALARDFGPGDRILTAEAEYASNAIAFLQVAARTGARVDVVPSDTAGQLDVAALERMTDERVKLIAVTHVPTNSGLVNPAAAIGRVARAAGIPYLLDACQSIGQMPIDVAALGCDVLAATGRKFLRGPRGTGFLYVRRELIAKLEPPFLDLRAADWVATDQYQLRDDARRFETWGSFVAGRLGLAAAANYAMGWGLEAIHARVRRLAEALRDRLGALQGATMHDIGDERCGIVSFSLAGTPADAVKARLRENGVNVSTTTALGTRWDAERRALPDMARASVHYYNTEAELDRLIAALAE